MLSAEEASALFNFTLPEVTTGRDFAREIADVMVYNAAHRAQRLQCRVPPHFAFAVAEQLAALGYEVVRLERRGQPTGRLNISWPPPSTRPRNPKKPAKPGAHFIGQDPTLYDTGWYRVLLALGWASSDPYLPVELEERPGLSRVVR
jgi:hypothetical protein